jgi:hypothetical protein
MAAWKKRKTWTCKIWSSAPTALTIGGQNQHLIDVEVTMSFLDYPLPPWSAGVTSLHITAHRKASKPCLHGWPWVASPHSSQGRQQAEIHSRGRWPFSPPPALTRGAPRRVGGTLERCKFGFQDPKLLSIYWEKALYWQTVEPTRRIYFGAYPTPSPVGYSCREDIDRSGIPRWPLKLL